MKVSFLRKALLAAFTVIGLIAVSAEAQSITIQNPGFGPVGGSISGTLDLNVIDPAPSAITQQLGTSGWYGKANVTTTLNIGFRPGIEVNGSAASTGTGYISYGLGAGLGGLLGLEMPDSYLWQPLTGISLLANKTYTFSIDMTTSSLLDLTALGNRGFGIGVTTGSTTSSVGTFFADSQTTPGLLNLSLLGGNSERMTLTFTTGASPTAGTVGLAIFAGRGTQGLSVSLLNDYTVDNAAFVMVPEPSSALMLISGLSALAFIRPRRAALGV